MNETLQIIILLLVQTNVETSLNSQVNMGTRKSLRKFWTGMYN